MAYRISVPNRIQLVRSDRFPKPAFRFCPFVRAFKSTSLYCRSEFVRGETQRCIRPSLEICWNVTKNQHADVIYLLSTHFRRYFRSVMLLDINLLTSHQPRTDIVHSVISRECGAQSANDNYENKHFSEHSAVACVSSAYHRNTDEVTRHILTIHARSHFTKWQRRQRASAHFRQQDTIEQTVLARHTTTRLVSRPFSCSSLSRVFGLHTVHRSRSLLPQSLSPCASLTRLLFCSFGLSLSIGRALYLGRSLLLTSRLFCCSVALQSHSVTVPTAPVDHTHRTHVPRSCLALS